MAVLTAGTRRALSVLAAAHEAPNDVALIIAGRAWSWAELGDRVRRVLRWVARGSHGSAERIAVVPRLDVASISLVLALIESRRTMVLVHPRLTAPERAEIMSSVDLDGASSAIEAGEVEEEALRCEPLDDDRVAARAAAEGDDEQCLAIIHTSGTTGRPKGAMLSRRAFVSSARASAENLGWRSDDRWLLAMPLAHVGGLSIVVRCLIARRCVVVPEGAGTDRFDGDAIRRVMQRDRVTIASFVPTMMKRVLESGELQPGLRAILLGGAATSRAVLSLARERKVPVLTTYGLTEACSQVTTQRYGTEPSTEQGSGVPMRGTEVRIALEEEGQRREGGRIEVRSDTLMSGYFGHKARVVPGQWLRTDDFGRVDDAGRLHVLGRTQELLVTGGENVYPLEVERALESIRGVAAACVFGIEDEAWGDVICAALVVVEGIGLDEIKEAIEARLARHKRPARVAILNDLQLTPAGKLDRRATSAAAAPFLREMWR